MTERKRDLLVLEWLYLDSLIVGLTAQMSEARAQGDEAEALRKERAVVEAQLEKIFIRSMLVA